MEDGGVKIEGGGCRARALTYVKRIGVGRAKSRRQRAPETDIGTYHKGTKTQRG